MAEDVMTKEPTDGQTTAAPAEPVVEPTDKPADSQAADAPVKSILDENEDKPADEPKAPAEYGDFTMPEGVTADEGALSTFKPLAAEFGLSQEQAQKLVDLYANGVKQAADAQAAGWESTVKGWTQEIQADPEFGGMKFKESTGLAVKALNAYGDPELRAYLQKTKLSNHPGIWKMLARVGKDISEDKALDGGPAKAETSAAKTLYPGMN